MRNELEDAEVKSKEIDEMFAWLNSEKNRQFDFDAFYDANDFDRAQAGTVYKLSRVLGCSMEDLLENPEL